MWICWYRNSWKVRNRGGAHTFSSPSAAPNHHIIIIVFISSVLMSFLFCFPPVCLPLSRIFVYRISVITSIKWYELLSIAELMSLTPLLRYNWAQFGHAKENRGAVKKTRAYYNQNSADWFKYTHRTEEISCINTTFSNTLWRVPVMMMPIFLIVAQK